MTLLRHPRQRQARIFPPCLPPVYSPPLPAGTTSSHPSPLVVHTNCRRQLSLPSHAPGPRGNDASSRTPGTQQSNTTRVSRVHLCITTVILMTSITRCNFNFLQDNDRYQYDYHYDYLHGNHYKVDHSTIMRHHKQIIDRC